MTLNITTIPAMPRTVAEIEARINAIHRRAIRCCNDGDGHYDVWDTEDDNGDLVAWADVQALLEWIKGKDGA